MRMNLVGLSTLLAKIRGKVFLYFSIFFLHFLFVLLLFLLYDLFRINIAVLFFLPLFISAKKFKLTGGVFSGAFLYLVYFLFIYYFDYGRRHSSSFVYNNIFLFGFVILAIGIGAGFYFRVLEKLNNLKDKYVNFIEGTDSFILRSDKRGRITFTNHISEVVLGLKPEECIGKRAIDFIHPEDIQKTKKKFLSLVKHRRLSGNHENRIVGLNGQIHYMLWTLQFHYDENGYLERMDNIARDITELKEAEVALLKNESRLKKAQKIAKIASWEKNYQTGEIFWSEELYILLGYENTKVVPSFKLFSQHLYEDDRKNTLGIHIIKKLIQSNKPLDIEFRFLNQKKEIRYARAQLELEINESGKWLFGTFQDITERKKIDEKLKIEKERLLNILEILPAFVYLQKSDYTIAYGNQKFKEYFGDFTDKKCYEILVSRGSPCVDCKTFGVFEKKEKLEWEWTDAQGRLFQVIDYPIQDYDGTDLVLEMGIDITEKKQAMDAINRERNLFIGGPVTVFKWKLQDAWPIEYVSPNVIQYGFDTQDFFDGKLSYLDIVHPEDRKRVKEQVYGNIELGLNTIEQDYRIICPDNEIIWFYDFTVVVKDENGVATHLDGYVLNVTERVLREKAIKKSELSFKTIIQSSYDAILIVDENRKVQFANHAAEVLFEKTAEDLQDLNPPLLNGNKTEIDIPQQDGTIVVAEMKNGEIQWEGKKATLVSFHDITSYRNAEIKIKEAKEKAEEADRAKSEFLANMSHELRTPLNGILGYTQILKKEKGLTEFQIKSIDIIEQSGMHLLNLINDILDLSKIEAKKMQLNEDEFHLPSFLEGIIGMIKMRATDKGLKFNFEIISDIPHFTYGDNRLLGQVLLNLLSNSVKYTEKGTITLTIGYVENGKKLRFQVEDTGIGIPDDMIQDIFSPFKQVEMHIRNVEGTGLGLSISQKLVNMMGGQLQVESIPNQGSKFWFDIELPEVSKETEKKETNSSKIIGYEGKRIKILIVEDILENRMILNRLLSTIGFEVLEAKNGLDGFNKAKETFPDLVLMDLYMPVMDGFQSIKKIRETPELHKTKIFTISASSEDFITKKFSNIGCTDYILKPVIEKEILEKIQKHLHLNWIYEKKDDTQDENGLKKDVELVRPPINEINSLYTITKRGDIKRLNKELDKLENLDAKYKPFVKVMRNLASTFQINKIGEFLEIK